jgi:hypothetical protein
MATFERYFIKEKETHEEEKGNYFKLRDDEKVCESIMDAFGVKGENRHIINGHVPVRVGKGENPIKANGRLMVIDGGFSQAYHKETGIAGYTLVYHSRGFQLVQHEPFTSTEDAILRGTDIKSTTQIVEMSSHRMLVADTDKGIELNEQIADLQELLYAYRHGYIKEKDTRFLAARLSWRRARQRIGNHHLVGLIIRFAMYLSLSGLIHRTFFYSHDQRTTRRYVNLYGTVAKKYDIPFVYDIHCLERRSMCVMLRRYTTPRHDTQVQTGKKDLLEELHHQVYHELAVDYGYLVLVEQLPVFREFVEELEPAVRLLLG